jgi:hypothetical protein
MSNSTVPANSLGEHCDAKLARLGVRGFRVQIEISNGLLPAGFDEVL